MELCSLPVGKCATITHINLPEHKRKRLFELGLTIGARISLCFNSVSGDPAAYHTMGATIALRKSDAKMINVCHD